MTPQVRGIHAMTDARRLGPIMIMLVGLGMVISSFVATHVPSGVNVGGVTPTTNPCVQVIGVSPVCPTTTVAATTTVAPTTTSVAPTTVAPTTTVLQAPGVITRPPTTAAPAVTDETEPAVAHPAPSNPGQGQLAFTGTPSVTLLLAGVVVLLIGGVLLLASRRRNAA